MIIKIGDYKEITVSKRPSVTRDKYTGRLTMIATIPNEEVDGNTLMEIRAYIKENSPEILVCDDTGTVIETMTGFSKKVDFHITEFDEWELIIENKSELERQYGLLLDENARLKTATEILAEENAASIEFEAELLYELSLMQLGLL